MIVYKISNNFNNKVYIGATKRSLKERWKEHCTCGEKGGGHAHELYREMHEHGIENFKIEILKECVSFDELYDTETKFIQDYNAVECGYNTYHCSPTREDWEEFYQHMKDSMTDEVKRQISKTLKSYRSEHPFSEQHKQRLSEKALGNKNGECNLSHSVACLCTGKYGRHEFRNYKEAGLWWYNTCKPFGEKYSQATYQRKIIDCIDKGYCYFKRKKYKFDDIKWFRK